MPKEERRKFTRPTESLCLLDPDLCLFRFQKVATIFQMQTAELYFPPLSKELCMYSSLDLILLSFYGPEILNEEQNQHNKVILILAYFMLISDHMHIYIYIYIYMYIYICILYM